MLCLDRQTGKTLWQKVLREEAPHEGHHPSHGYASHSPVTDGKHVFAYFGSRGLHCLDMDGNVKWQKDLGRMKTLASFGEGSSPALCGNVIIVNWDHENGSFVAAFDKETGNELWRQPRDEKSSWATPLVVQQGDDAQVVVAATKKIRCYEVKTGRLVWECAGMTANVIPTPVLGDGVLYATSGYGGNAMLAIRLGRTGDLTGTDAIVWSVRKNTPYVPSPLLYNNRIYMFRNIDNVLSCLDAKDGRAIIDAQKVDGIKQVYASPVGERPRLSRRPRGHGRRAEVLRPIRSPGHQQAQRRL